MGMAEGVKDKVCTCYQLTQGGMAGNCPQAEEQSGRCHLQVAGGYRPEIPADMPEAVRALVEACWAQEACARPNACEVKKALEVRDA